MGRHTKQIAETELAKIKYICILYSHKTLKNTCLLAFSISEMIGRNFHSIEISNTTDEINKATVTKISGYNSR